MIKQMKTILKILIAIALCYLIWSFILMEVDSRNWSADQRLGFVFTAIISCGMILFYKFLEKDENTTT